MTNLPSQPRLVSVRCCDYLAFHQPAEIALRPLTLILGRNNSGKSALIRLIRLALRAATPLRQREAPQRGQLGAQHLPLSIGGISFGTRFVDLVYGRLPRPLSLGLSLEVEGQPCGYDAELIPVNTSERSWLNRLTANDPGLPKTTIELDLEATNRNQIATYRGRQPPNLPGAMLEGFDGLQRAASTLEGAVSHIGPMRARVPPVLQRDLAAQLGFDGSGAPQLMARNDELADQIDHWYRDNLDGARLQVSPLADAFSLATTMNDGVQINLAQAGEGLHQVLPVVAQQLAHRTGPPTDILDLVEQPELHLHEGIHAPLADLFLDTARLGRGSVVVETHSEGLLLRVRRRIVEGKFRAEDVAIHFVDRGANGAVVRRIEVNGDGELSDWPEGVFLESYREVLAMQRAIRDRKPS